MPREEEVRVGLAIRDRRSAACSICATSGGARCFSGVKTFLKVLLLVVLALVAIKLLPVTLGLGFVLGLLLIALAAVGISVVAGVAVVGVFFAAVLSPIWIPVLLVVAMIALIKRSTRRTA